MKTGIKEIDEIWKNQGQGELTVIGVDNDDNWYLKRILLPYIIHNTASEINVRNQSKIPHYKRILKKAEEYLELTKREQKEAAVGIDYVLAIGNFPSLSHEYISFYPCENRWLKEKYTEHFDVFADLPIITFQEDSGERWPCNSLKDFNRRYLDKVRYRTTDYFPQGIGAIFADFGVHGYKYAKILKELAQQKNIPVFLVVPYHYKRYTDKFISFKNLNHFGVLTQYADKFILGVSNFNVPEKCFKDGVCIRRNVVYYQREKGVTYFLYDMRKRETHAFKNRIYDVFLKRAYYKKDILHGTPAEILHKMARNPEYCNKDNFSSYMKLSRKQNKKFWNYLEVFERGDIDELYDHIFAYKKGMFDKQELTLATVVLYQMLFGYNINGAGCCYGCGADSLMITLKDKEKRPSRYFRIDIDSKVN